MTQQTCYHQHLTPASVFLARVLGPVWTCRRCYRPLTFDACERIGLDGTHR